MINSSSGLKDLYDDIKETLKSIKVVSITTFIGVFFRVVYPEKFQTILEIIDGEMLKFMVSIIDLLFASYLLLACITMILGIIFWLLWKICDGYSNKKRLFHEEMISLLDTLQRSFYGCDIRFINLSQWVIAFFGILFVLDVDKFLTYINPLKQIGNNQDFKLYEVFFMIAFIIIMLRAVVRLAKKIFYKYLYFHPLKDHELSK